jgi:hypothetical protein
MKVYDGDEWKSASAPATQGPTRAEAQKAVNDAYLARKITIEQWRKETNELGELSRWTAAGRVK